MYFLLKIIFWLSVILLIIPIGIGQNEEAPQINPFEALVAAKSTVGDISGFCERNPSTCETGKSIVSLVGLKAKQAARLAYSYMNDTEIKPDTVEYLQVDQNQVEPATTIPSISLPEALVGRDLDITGTLTTNDIKIPWKLAPSHEDKLSNGQSVSIEHTVSQLNNEHISEKSRFIPLPRPDPR